MGTASPVARPPFAPGGVRGEHRLRPISAVPAPPQAPVHPPRPAGRSSQQRPPQAPCCSCSCARDRQLPSLPPLLPNKPALLGFSHFLVSSPLHPLHYNTAAPPHCMSMCTLLCSPGLPVTAPSPKTQL